MDKMFWICVARKKSSLFELCCYSSKILCVLWSEKKSKTKTPKTIERPRNDNKRNHMPRFQNRQEANQLWESALSSLWVSWPSSILLTQSRLRILYEKTKKKQETCFHEEHMVKSRRDIAPNESGGLCSAAVSRADCVAPTSVKSLQALCAQQSSASAKLTFAWTKSPALLQHSWQF